MIWTITMWGGWGMYNYYWIGYEWRSSIIGITSANLRLMTDPVIVSIRTRHLHPVQHLNRAKTLLMRSVTVTSIGFFWFFFTLSTNRLTVQVQIFLPCTFGPFHEQSPERNHQNNLWRKKNIHRLWSIIVSVPLNLTYFHPTIDPQPTQKMSATVCNPVIINLSSFTPKETLTLSNN